MSRSNASTRPRFDSLQQEVFLNLWRTYDRLKQIEDEVFGQEGISAQQYNALRLLHAVHPDSMQTLELGRRLISRAPDITRLLDRLEQLGFLERERRSDNRRVVQVRIVSAGIELLDRIHSAVQDSHQRQLGHMSESSLNKLARLLRQARRPHEDLNHPSLLDE